MRAALDAILRRFITIGRLTVRWPDGESRTYGGGGGPEVALTLTSNAAVRRLLFNPALAAGELYMDGGLVPDGCGIYDVLEVLITNRQANQSAIPTARLHDVFGAIKRRLDQYNPARRAQRNVAHHYDLNGRLYSLFLDRDRQYSCAYFPRGDETLEEAQMAKKRHIAAKLCLTRPDLEVLDVGCGWGGLALTLARDYGARVTGITLSQEQLAEARNRAIAEGLQDRVDFQLLDYRAVHRDYDRIVSVGMFEHVGVNHYRSFFDVLGRCLRPDGVALLHAIGRSDGPGSTNAWIRKYIFPGGYCPALSEVLPRIEHSGLVATDIEVLRLHYAETLRNWRRRFIANQDAIATLYDERFCRMFEFYLCGSELAFRRDGHMVFQIQLAHQQTAAPLTRDYITVAETAAANRQRAAVTVEAEHH
ncbi:MAG TPA: cyclopropane-fatty-acyl-phospholipid synthase family protein [Acetobacteraceae bacterium]|nr:cyclopropane-fatty-acyl-phospholipid synthase family protein [Acetobacteraceae bacterium]